MKSRPEIPSTILWRKMCKWKYPNVCISGSVYQKKLSRGAVFSRHCSCPVLIYLQKRRFFFFIALVITDFCSRLWINLMEMLLRRSEFLFFNSTAVIDEQDVASHSKRLSILGEVLLGAPKPDFFFTTIQCQWCFRSFTR